MTEVRIFAHPDAFKRKYGVIHMDTALDYRQAAWLHLVNRKDIHVITAYQYMRDYHSEITGAIEYSKCDAKTLKLIKEADRLGREAAGLK